MQKRKSYILLLLTTLLCLSACSQQTLVYPRIDHIINLANFNSLAYRFDLIACLIVMSIFQLSLLLVRKGDIKKLKETNKDLNESVRSSTDELEKLRKELEMQETELKQMSDLFEQFSLRDNLTGLCNKNQYEKSIKIEWNRGLRHERAISILVVDIDNFKLYNEYYGHKAGDECLIKIGNEIRSLFKRVSDIPIRYDREVFVVILPEQGKGEALKMAERLRQRVVELNIPHKTSPINPWLTVSIGVNTIIPSMKCSSNELFLGADRAVFKAKELGKNRVEFDPYGEEQLEFFTIN